MFKRGGSAKDALGLGGFVTVQVNTPDATVAVGRIDADGFMDVRCYGVADERGVFEFHKSELGDMDTFDVRVRKAYTMPYYKAMDILGYEMDAKKINIKLEQDGI